VGNEKLIFISPFLLWHLRKLNYENFIKSHTITNLAFNDFVIKFVQSLFIHRFVCFAHELLWIENKFDKQINLLTNEIQTYE
jgi:hypothetical protein